MTSVHWEHTCATGTKAIDDQNKHLFDPVEKPEHAMNTRLANPLRWEMLSDRKNCAQGDAKLTGEVLEYPPIWLIEHIEVSDLEIKGLFSDELFSVNHWVSS